jgi:hypothetical protein
MSFNKVLLPNFIIADLYKDSLVITHNERKSPLSESIPNNKSNEPIEPSPLQPNFLGSNLKKITIIINDNKAVYLRDEWLEFLINILAACKLAIADVAIINITQHSEINISSIKKISEPKFVLLFDISTTQIGMPLLVPEYQVQNFDNCTFLVSASLSKMLGSGELVKAEKTKLWNSLKRMFSL